MKRSLHNFEVADSYLQAETSPYLCLERLFLVKGTAFCFSEVLLTLTDPFAVLNTRAS